MCGYDNLTHMKFNFYTVAAFLFLALAARAQTTAFTYQGQLNSSNDAVTGTYDFRFRIFDANSNVVAGPLTNAPVGVTNGLFTVALDFGASVFNGSSRSLEIAVRGYGDTNAYTALSPWQTLTSVPYAIQSLNALNAVALTAPLQATNLAGTIPNSLLSPNVAVLTNNVIFSGGVTATNFTGNGYGLSNVPGTSLVGIITGNGSGLSSVPATSLIGTIPDARLSANVALQSNPNLNFAGAVSATNFTGAGHGLTNVPGAFFWVTVAANTQAQPNVGYICNNGVAPVTITLPSSPSAGDVYKVAGVGAGGWIIAQNANQMIAAGNLSAAVFQSWKAGASALNWSAIASSADGTKLVAAVNNGYIWTSANSGATWTQQNGSSGSGSRYWSSVASSSDGTHLVAAVGYTIYTANQPGAIYTSTDSGVTWASHTSSPLSSSMNWSSVASSADGTKLVAAVRSGPDLHFLQLRLQLDRAGAEMVSFGFPSPLRPTEPNWWRWRITAKFTPPPTPALYGHNASAAPQIGSPWRRQRMEAGWSQQPAAARLVFPRIQASPGLHRVRPLPAQSHPSLPRPTVRGWQSPLADPERQATFLPPPIPARPGRNWQERPPSRGRTSLRPPTAASLRQRSMAATFTFPPKAARRPARRVI